MASPHWSSWILKRLCSIRYFVFLNKPRNRVKVLYWECNGFCLRLKRLESKRFKTSPDVYDEAIVHELTCVCGCRKHTIGEEISEQLEIVPMQIRVIKHIRKVYASRDCEEAPVTADNPAQIIEKSMASLSVLAVSLTNKYVDDLPLHCFDKCSVATV